MACTCIKENNVVKHIIFKILQTVLHMSRSRKSAQDRGGSPTIVSTQNVVENTLCLSVGFVVVSCLTRLAETQNPFSSLQKQSRVNRRQLAPYKTQPLNRIRLARAKESS